MSSIPRFVFEGSWCVLNPCQSIDDPLDPQRHPPTIPDDSQSTRKDTPRIQDSVVASFTHHTGRKKFVLLLR